MPPKVIIISNSSLDAQYERVIAEAKAKHDAGMSSELSQRSFTDGEKNKIAPQGGDAGYPTWEGFDPGHHVR